MFVHAAKYFRPYSDDIKQAPTKDSYVLLRLIHPMDCFNSLVKEHDKVTQVRLKLKKKKHKRQRYNYLLTGGERRCLLK